MRKSSGGKNPWFSMGWNYMRGIAIMRTFFGYRQNDRRGILLGWPWPALRWVSLPVFPPLTQEEILGSSLRWGWFCELYETGEPRWKHDYRRNGAQAR